MFFSNDKFLTAHSFRDILPHCHFNSFVVLDLDNTVMEPVQELGSDQWFYALRAVLFEQTHDKALVEKNLLTLYNALQNIIKMQPVESNIATIIAHLQKIKIPVLGLTARFNCASEATIQQLAQINVDFHQQWKNHLHLDISPDSPPALLKNGIIFCNEVNKGQVLKQFFKKLRPIPDRILPARIIMLDDRPDNIKNICAAFAGTDCEVIGLRYDYLDKKCAKVNLQQAAEDLLAIQHRLPESVQSLIPSLQPQL